MTVDAFDLKNRDTGCVPYNPAAKAPTYGYVPGLAAGIVYSVVFGLITLGHVAQTVKYRKWWYITFALGAVAELIGWAGRAAAHHCPYDKTLFSLQISILIIAPCFYSAGLYYVLGQMIAQYGRKYSPISPRLYLIIFISFDILSIAIQAVGGGLASSAGGKVPPGNTAPGTHTMMAGIIIQLISMSVFCMLWLWFCFAARVERYSRILAVTTSFVAALILIRNFYRAVELSQGWTGYLITHEDYFIVLDGMLMAIAPLIYNIFHPARYVNGIPEDAALAGSTYKMDTEGANGNAL